MGEQVEGTGCGFRLGLARTHFSFSARSSQGSTEDSCLWCNFSPLAPKTLAFLPSGSWAQARGLIQPIWCSCPEPLDLSGAPAQNHVANQM